MDKNYRVHTNIISDTVLNVNLRQDMEFLEVLTMKIGQVDAYKLHSSNYGVVVGRVLANDAYGIPNAKVSLFIPNNGNESVEVDNIYPFKSTQSFDRDWTRYNLLQDYSDDGCYRVVGKFPRKRYLLDNDTLIEVYEKYWKYTTVTNSCGDYMLFGVPSGNHTIHVDVDISDIGPLSQKPRDLMAKGYSETMFDSPTQFKESESLASLVQIFSQDSSVNVYPFWGDDDVDVISITRCDVQISYKFESTCVFMGAIVSDNGNNSIGHKCEPSKKSGMNNQLVAGTGTIEMIRKTTDGLTEEFPINGNQLINGDGVWCYQIPMNLDYVGMDEYGNIVPTNDVQKGIATRARVRFRISKSETGEEGLSRHTAKYLVPMNPMFSEKDGDTVPVTVDDGSVIESMYNFGSSTPLDCFRDLYWGNVYSVKNFIPKIQIGRRPNTPKYNAIKSVNVQEDKNGAPFNKIRIDIPITYMIVCILFEIVMFIVQIVNTVIWILMKIKYLKILTVRPFKHIIPGVGCIAFGAGLDGEDEVWYPGCHCPGSDACKNTDCPDGFDNDCTKVSGSANIKDKMQQKLAMEFNIVRLDFYQDWLNGCLYMPQWYWRKRKKKKFLFGLFTIRHAKNEFCDCDKEVGYPRLKSYVSCEPTYSDTNLGLSKDDVPEDEEKWHQSKERSKRVWFRKGVIKPVENKDGLVVYYYAAIQATSANKKKTNASVGDFDEPFYGIRLYATDIILLGNINENNIYGIPQFYKCLEPSSANVPEIASVTEEATDSDDDVQKNSGDDEEDNAPLTITGMDWGNKGNKTTPKYGRGLFIDLSCTWAHTKAKSCFNVERLCELGVGLDMSHSMQYSDGLSVVSGMFEPDGFISKYEIYDNENRAMFATMNHIGFVPQDYHEKHEETTHVTQFLDERTGYYIPLFKFMYPMDFDGRQTWPMNMYRKKFAQDMVDMPDMTYVSYRLGEGEHHFYFNEDGGYGMPLYNNSFYFYFGINVGKTAIDKFNSLFNGTCSQRSKNPFTLIGTSIGRSYCPDIYKEERACEAYPYIFMKLDDIETPYSYTLYDAEGRVVISERGLEDERGIVIGGTLGDDGRPSVYCDGFIHLHDEEETVTDKMITNQDYTLVVVDGNGMSLKERVTVSMPKITLNFETVGLGATYYNSTDTPVELICDKYKDFYGVMYLKDFMVDGYMCTITNITSVSINSDGVLSFYLIGYSDVSDYVTAVVEIEQVYTSGVTMDYCLCQIDNMVIDTNNNAVYFYYPSTYSVKITQLCDDVLLDENTTTQSMTIANGKMVEMLINEMPARFMIEEERGAPDYYKNGNFYINSPSNIADGTGLKGWLGVHDEKTYLFDKLPITVDKADVWWEYADFDDITTVDGRKGIIVFKFNAIFGLSSGAYVGDGSDNSFIVEGSGGKPPILYKDVKPMYDSEDMNEIANYHVYADENMVTSDGYHPNIVGNNYAPYKAKDKWDYKPVINSTKVNKLLFYSSSYVGNYFAVYAKDGGYQSDGTVDESIYIDRYPHLAALNVGNLNKKKGDIVTTKIEPKLKNVYQQIANISNPFLRAMFVDRAHDYDFILIGTFDEAYATKKGIDDLFVRARLSGNTYNGIEMAYDDRYNIISADTVFDDAGEILEYAPNSGLEYSYCISAYSDDPDHEFSAYTVYNEETTQRKRFYQATINGYDIRDKYWYINGPVEIISADTEDEEVELEINNPLDHTDDYEDQVNGMFSLTNYPTKRLLDVNNIENDGFVKYLVRSCSYEIEAGTNRYGMVDARTRALDDTSFKISMVSPLIFDVTDDEEEEEVEEGDRNELLEHPNVKLNGGVPENDVSLECRFYGDEDGTFEVYPRSPFVMDAENIEWLKTMKSGVTANISEIISNNVKYDFGAQGNYKLPKKVSKISPSDAKFRRDGKACDGIGGFFREGKTNYLPISESKMQEIKFGNKKVSKSVIGNRFVVLTDSEYLFVEDEYRMRGMRVIHMSEVIDLNQVSIQVNFDGPDYEVIITGGENTVFNDKSAIDRLSFSMRVMTLTLFYYYSSPTDITWQSGRIVITGTMPDECQMNIAMTKAFFAVTESSFVYMFKI